MESGFTKEQLEMQLDASVTQCAKLKDELAKLKREVKDKVDEAYERGYRVGWNDGIENDIEVIDDTNL